MFNNTIKPRVNGFQWPPSRDQIKTLTVYPVITVCYFLLIFLLMEDKGLLIPLLAINCFLSVLLIIAWVTVEYIDPEMRPGKRGIPVICFAPAEKSSRFCGVCRKTVAGLDHHCTWLNTCIGRRNYVSFISLVFIGTTQSILQTVVGVFALGVWIGNGTRYARILNFFDGKVWGFFTAVSLYTTISGFLSLGLLTLAAFHTYLMLYMGMGTYDWLLYRRGSTYDASFRDEGRDPDLSGRERKKQKEREEWQRIINNSKRKKSVAIETKESGSGSGNTNIVLNKVHLNIHVCNDCPDWTVGALLEPGLEGDDKFDNRKPTSRMIIANKRRSSTDIESGILHENSSEGLSSPIAVGRSSFNRIVTSTSRTHQGINSEINSSSSYESSEGTGAGIFINTPNINYDINDVRIGNVDNTQNNLSMIINSDSKENISNCPEGNEIQIVDVNYPNENNDGNKNSDKNENSNKYYFSDQNSDFNSSDNFRKNRKLHEIKLYTSMTNTNMEHEPYSECHL